MKRLSRWLNRFKPNASQVQKREGLISVSVPALSPMKGIRNAEQWDESAACYPKLLNRWQSAQVKIETIAGRITNAESFQGEGASHQ
jgi:hypothetical protein